MMHSGSLDNVVKIAFVDGALDAERSDFSALPRGASLSVDGQQYSLTLADDATLLLVEEHTGVLSNSNQIDRRVDITLGARSKLNYLQWQNLPALTHHEATYVVTQAADSQLRAGFFASGSAKEHQHIAIDQRGERADSQLYGFCQPTRDGQDLRHSVDVLHTAPFGKSGMNYKGILDAQSKASFRGRVKVPASGKGVEAHQSNHWLLLSNRAEAFSRPELEIDQEDIRCSHGATVGQMDEEALFYLCSRGVPRRQAEKMLRQAFVMDIFECVPALLLPWLRAALEYADDA